MILGFCHKGLVRVGAGLLRFMGRFRVVPDVCSYNILIKGHFVFVWSADAFKLFDEMRVSGCKPTVVTYNILVDALCCEWRMADARTLFDEMVQVGIKANTITFNVLIDGYAKAGQMDEANAACREMKSRGLQPDCCTFNILSAGAYKFGSAVQLAHDQQPLHEMFGSQMSADGLDMLVCRLCWDGRFDDAWELLRGAIEQGVAMSVAGFNALIAAYSKEGFNKAAFELYRVMNNLGLSPSLPTFNYLIMGLCNEGWLDEAQLLLEHIINKGYCVSTSFTIYLDASFREWNAVDTLKCWDDMEKTGLQYVELNWDVSARAVEKLRELQECFSVQTNVITVEALSPSVQEMPRPST
ncbi:pentatricopeptide repeat-containing protein At4g11690-like [Phragmites australis]|uniref:pentatricopeptide repeat-containing protein At4g11690-like n=1 Tax=Phragmites australis TaxID=29695 RepID=UPI002D7679AD|nr:pentatricopeptide repeat-containing protein At4g11690-like [Phragmites australis]